MPPPLLRRRTCEAEIGGAERGGSDERGRGRRELEIEREKENENEREEERNLYIYLGKITLNYPNVYS